MKRKAQDSNPLAKLRTKKRAVFIVEDHPLVREGFSTVINDQADLVVCGDAGSVAHALTTIPAAAPDLVIADISLPDRNGFSLIKELRAGGRQMPILMLSMFDEQLYAEAVLRAGAQGYVMKDESTGTLLRAIRCVLDGKIYLSKRMAARLPSIKPTGDSPAAA